MKRIHPVLAVGVAACAGAGTEEGAGAAGWHSPAEAPANAVIDLRATEASPAQASGAAPVVPASPSAAEATLLDEPPLIQPAPSECALRIAGTDESRALLEPYVIRHDSFHRRTLYSWTVPEQIAELRSDPTLLTRAMSSDGERGRASNLILEWAASDEFAALLAEARFEKKRFGWSNPWATVLGFTGEDYGDRLLSITLKEEAIIGRLIASPGGLDWTFHDLSGELLDRETVLANSDRIAAVYFADQRDPSTCGGTFVSLGSVMREFFLCNESMVESWSVHTEEIRAEVGRGIAAIETLRSALAGRACSEASVNPLAPSSACWRARVIDQWSETVGDLPTLLGMYEKSLAFPNDLYLPRLDNLDRLVERLTLVPFDEEPIVHVATE